MRAEFVSLDGVMEAPGGEEGYKHTGWVLAVPQDPEQLKYKVVSGVDVAFDTVGGETTESLLPTVREGGILVTIAGAPPEEAARERNVRAELCVMSPSSEQLARIGELVAAGDVRVELAEVLPLTEVQRAHELSESRHVRGRSS